jgi:TnpA family transposase
MLRKLASYPGKNGLARALRELGRIERRLFLIAWFLGNTAYLERAVRHAVASGRSTVGVE